MPSNRSGSIYERSSSFTSSFALIAFTSTLTLFLAHLAARQPQPILQQPPFQQPQPSPPVHPVQPAQPSPPVHPVQPAQPPPSEPLPPPSAPPLAPPAPAPIAPPLSHSVPPLQQPTLIWLGNNGSGILYALLVLVLLFGLSGVWIERIAPSPTHSGYQISEAEAEVEDHKSKKKMQPSTSRLDPSSEEDSEEARIPGRWMNRMEAKIDRMQRKVNKERKQRKSRKDDDSDSSSSSTSSSSYERTRRKTYRYRRSSSTRYDDRSCIDHGVRLHKRRDSYCCEHCGTIVAVCAGSGATLDAPPPPIPVMASNVPPDTDEITKIKIESTSTISKEEIEKAVNLEVERRLREYEKRLEEEISKRLKREQEDAKKEEKKEEKKEDKKNNKKNEKKSDETNDKWNEAWENDGWEKTEEKVTTKTETKIEKKDQASSSSTSATTSKSEDDNPTSDQPSEESQKVEKEKVEIKVTVKEKEKEKGKGKEKEKDKSNEPQTLPGILKKTPSLESNNDNDDDEKSGRISQKMHGFREDIRDWVGDLKTDAKEAVQDVGEFAEEIKDEAKEKAQDVKGKAKEIVHSVTHLGSDSKDDTDKDQKEADSSGSTNQAAQLQDSVKERIVSKVTHKDEIELQKSSKNVKFADPIHTEQEIPAITDETSDKGKGKAREEDDEDRPSSSSFAEAPIPMPDIVSPYEIDEDRFIGVKSSVSSTSSSSGSSSGSGGKDDSSKVKEKTRISISTDEQGKKVISTEKVSTTQDTEDDDEKESQASETYRESEFTETIFGIVDKIVDGFSGKKSKSKSKKVEKDDAEVKIDVSVTKETTPKVEDEKDAKDANDDKKGKDVVEESSESTVKEKTKTKTSEEVKETTSEEKGKAKEEVVIVEKADVGQPAFTAEELYLETAKYLSEKYPELVAKETVRVNSSLDQTYEEGKASIKEEKTTSDANDQAHQDGDEPAQAETAAIPSQEATTSTTNLEEITTKAQDGSDAGDTKSNSGEEAMLRALGTIRQYGSGTSYSNLESKYYESYFRQKVERSADDVLLSLINSLLYQPQQSSDKSIKFAASALQGSSKIKEKMKFVKTTEKEETQEVQDEDNEAEEKQVSSSSNFPEKISADAIKAASIAAADQIRRHQAQLRPQDESFFKFLKKDTARSFDDMKDGMKDASSKLGKFTGTLKRKVSKGSLKRSPSPSAERRSASIDAPERFDASQVTNFKGQESKSKEKEKKKNSKPTPYGIPLKKDSSGPPPTPYGLQLNKPPVKKPLVQFDRKVNVLEFHDPSTSSSSGSSSSTDTKQQTSNKSEAKEIFEKAKEVEDVYARITKLTRRLSEK
ncbi:uncharacterized protein FA14DRAFT_179451 [Meira miltonrushii]|uniref:Uncharacterized protein n=1 Tax=Meira miltonrushii TaxID=1280837 RepID=A0A316VEK4_9BASI|nr:uncharacterized protein FA14DRAFT_179451 [Meira miltonrushii]PWN36087.1 hypothetical protein FA14DRAFT_179451 [Meira miltonrushii]